MQAAVTGLRRCAVSAPGMRVMPRRGVGGGGVRRGWSPGPGREMGSIGGSSYKSGKNGGSFRFLPVMAGVGVAGVAAIATSITAAAACEKGQKRCVPTPTTRLLPAAAPSCLRR